MTTKRKKARKRRPASSRPRPPFRQTAPPPSPNEQALRERILAFAYQECFWADMQHALLLYFGEDALQNGRAAVDEAQIPGFQEWYINDYVTSEGERIIDLFARERGRQLPSAQQQILQDWRRVNRSRLFEVQEVWPGRGVKVKDLLSGEVLEVNDISSSHGLSKWQVLLARPLLTEGRLNFTGTMAPLTPLQKPALLDCARGLLEDYQAQHPRASLYDFYRDRSLELLHCRDEILREPPRAHYTPEGHPIVPCSARYTVVRPQEIEDRLDQAEEFVYVGPANKDEAAQAYVWVLTGRSHVPEVPVEKGIIHRTEWISESGELAYRSLGNVRLWPDRFELSCMSEERLEAGKALLSQILGDLIRHVEDEYRDLEKLIASAKSAPASRERDEVDPAIDRQVRVRMLDEWLDRPLSKLGGKSIREAARDPALQEEVDEIFKAFEYIEEQKRRDGEFYFDAAQVRRALENP